jgi:hypothetical protein
MFKNQLKELIEQTLREIRRHSTEAVDLLMGTAAQESYLAEYIRQVRGPALGLMQMEPRTFEDHYIWLSIHNAEMMFDIIDACNIAEFKPESMVYNLKFSICMARVHYLRRPEALPKDLANQAAYWKRYYNTYLGAGTIDEYISNYKRLVL